MSMHCLLSLQLEEFRKKRAADRAKKAASTNQIHASDGGLERQTLDTERIQPDSDGAGTSNAVATPASELSGVDKKYDFKESDIPQKTNFSSSNYASAGSTFAANNYDVEFSTSEVPHSKVPDFNGNNISKLSMPENDSNHSQKKGENDREVGSFAFEIASDHSAYNTLLPSFSNSGRVTSNSDYDGLHKSVSRSKESFLKDLSAVNSTASHTSIGNISPENSASTHVLEKTGLTDHWASGLTSASHQGT